MSITKVPKVMTEIPDVTNDAQLKRASGDFDSFTAKTSLVNADLVLIEDSADSLSKKKVTIENLKSMITFLQEVPSGTIDGSNLVFTLANTPAVSDSVMVFINGLIQARTTHYSLLGTTITFVSAPESGSDIYAVYIGV